MELKPSFHHLLFIAEHIDAINTGLGKNEAAQNEFLFKDLGGIIEFRLNLLFTDQLHGVGLDAPHAGIDATAAVRHLCKNAEIGQRGGEGMGVERTENTDQRAFLSNNFGHDLVAKDQ